MHYALEAQKKHAAAAEARGVAVASERDEHEAAAGQLRRRCDDLEARLTEASAAATRAEGEAAQRREAAQRAASELQGARGELDSRRQLCLAISQVSAPLW